MKIEESEDTWHETTKNQQVVVSSYTVTGGTELEYLSGNCDSVAWWMISPLHDMNTCVYVHLRTGLNMDMKALFWSCGLDSDIGFFLRII